MTLSDILSVLDNRGQFHIKPGLERMQRMARALGHPESAWAAIHVAGTNGKGSVSATLENILRHAGYKTGLYTSPHLVHLSERIRINGHPISDGQFIATAQDLFRLEKKLAITLTYFEFVTALAFLHFAQEHIVVGIIECGMGGRWDATNILPRPAVSVITQIGLDHTAWLGTTVQAIAREKAGIIKPDGFTVSGVEGAANQPISAMARQQRNVFYHYGRDFAGKPLHSLWQKPLQSWSYQVRGSPEKTFTTPLMGRHQVRNGAVTMKVIDLLREQAWRISPAAVAGGFQTVQWPGRMQLIRRANHPILLLDGAHNPQAMSKVALLMQEKEFKNRWKYFIFSAFSDKDISQMARTIGRLADRIYICELPGSRKTPLNTLAGILNPVREKVVVCPDGVAGALKRAWRETPVSGVIVGTGSLMLVGEILRQKRIFHG